jgi:hypothetical protein
MINMSKDIYELLNDANTDLSEYEGRELNDLEKRAIKSRFHKSVRGKKSLRNNKIAIAMAAAIIIGGVTLGPLNGQVKAAIDSIGSNIAMKLGIEADLESYETIVHKKVTDNGITIDLQSVVIDGSDLIVTDRILSDIKMDESGLESNISLRVNGKRIESGSSGSAWAVDDNTFEEVTNYDMGNIETNGNVKIEIEYNEIELGEKSISGDWKFAFETNGENLSVDTKHLAIDREFTLEDGSRVIIKEITLNELGPKVYYERSNINENRDFRFVLKGMDDLGNEIVFDGGRGTRKGGVIRLDVLSSNFSKDAKSLELSLYSRKMPQASGRMNQELKKLGDEFKIELQ